MIDCPRIVILVLAALLGAAGCGKSDAARNELPPASGEGAPPRAELPDVAVTPPGASSAAAAGETTGTTVAVTSAQIGPNASGVISTLAVDEGDTVKKGDLLLRLDTRDAALRVKQAEAGLRSAEVGLASAQLEWDRVQRLLAQTAIGQAQADRVKAQYDGAVVGVDQAKVALSMARKMLGDNTVRAPFDGVITQRLKSVGEMVTTMPPAVVFILEDHSKLELKFRMPERALRTVRVGGKVTARFNALGLERSAEIVRVSPNVDPRTRTVELVAAVDNPDRTLKPGMLAEIEFDGEAPAGPEGVSPAGTEPAPEPPR
jgi:RND family efflux transporter MFP subunit